MPEIAAIRDEASAEFFNATAHGRLLLWHCPTCDLWISPYQRFGPTSRSCPNCSATLEAVDADGRATVVSWTVVHHRASGGDEPFSQVAGIVELMEGPWLVAPLVDVDPDALRVGDPLVLDFVAPGGGESIPAFRSAR